MLAECDMLRIAALFPDRFENPVSEREFGEMSVDEKLDILRGCFGSLDEADFPKNETDDDQKPDLPGPGPRGKSKVSKQH